MKKVLLLFLVPLVIIGCDTKSPNQVSADDKKGLPQPSWTATGSTSSTSGSTAPDSTTVSTHDDSAMPDLKGTTLPANLDKTVMSYYGLSAPELPFTMTSSDSKTITTGSIHSSLKKVGQASATYVVDRTGGLAQILGNDTVEVRPDGVYIVGSSKGTLHNESLDMPVDLKVGKTWVENSSITTSEGDVSQKATAKVVKFGKVNTPIGDLDGVEIVSTGTIEASGQKGTLSSDAWFAKGYGMVKNTLSLTLSSSKSVKEVIEVQKPSSKAKSS